VAHCPLSPWVPEGAMNCTARMHLEWERRQCVATAHTHYCENHGENTGRSRACCLVLRVVFTCCVLVLLRVLGL